MPKVKDPKSSTYKAFARMGQWYVRDLRTGDPVPGVQFSYREQAWMWIHANSSS